MRCYVTVWESSLEFKPSNIFPWKPNIGVGCGTYLLTGKGSTTKCFHKPETELIYFCVRGKLKRMIAQFGPYNWIQFEWRPLSSLGRWCATLGIMFIVSNSEEWNFEQVKFEKFVLLTFNIFFICFLVFVDRIEHILLKGIF